MAVMPAIAPSTGASPAEVLVHDGSDASSLPLVIEPRVPGLGLAEWLPSASVFLSQALLQSGALLFRGFRVETIAEFERAAVSLTGELFGEYGDLPKENAGEAVYHSTPYPPDKHILFHNEASHTDRWPMKQWFYCQTPARQGGETPIVDCRRLHAALLPEERETFARKRLCYVRNFVEGLDVSWQDFFKTSDRAEVERYCGAAGITCSWRADGGLRATQVCDAILRHPRSREWVFFNQIQLHHVSSLDPEIRAALRVLFEEDELPRNVTYGDGSPIADSLVQRLTEQCREHAVAAPWQTHDVLLVDNMLVAHARNPFIGPRKIVVAMGDMMTRTGCKS